MRLTGSRVLSQNELKWCTDNLGTAWSKRLITCHNNTVLHPKDEDAKDDLALLLFSWRGSSDYPLRVRVNVGPDGKPMP